MALCSTVSILAIALILLFTFKEGLGVFHPDPETGFHFMDMWSGKNWQPVSDHPHFQVLPLFLGSLKVAALSMLFAFPIGLLAAIYGACYAPPRVRDLLKPLIEVLAGIPSVVIGFFALILMATFWQGLLHTEYRLNAWTAASAMALAIIPTVFTISEDAISRVPDSLRLGSLALGASLRQTILRVLVPAALPGIFAAGLLGLGRAIGETMIVLMASGNAIDASPSLVVSTRTVSATIAAEMAEVVQGDLHYSVLFFLGALLFLVTIGISFAAQAIGRYLTRRMTGVAA